MITANNDNTVPPSDEDLFNEPPQNEDCPICFLRLPTLGTGSKYSKCCGKVICSGCIHAPVYDNNGNKVKKKCPFCRTPTPTSDEEMTDLLKKRVEVDDAKAISVLGCCYAEALYGLPQDWDKALELWHRAGELGNVDSYHNIGYAYRYGRGVERDMKKATHYFELAAMGGDAMSRHNLGIFEIKAGNYERALKHYITAVEGGYYESLNVIQRMYKNGHAVKDDYMNALRAYQTYLGEVKSDDRDKAAALNRVNIYHE